MAADRAMPAAFYEERIRLLEAERQQAIDALEEIAKEDAAGNWPHGTKLGGIARAALLSLGEQS